MSMILNLLAEGVGQSRESAHVHTQTETLPRILDCLGVRSYLASWNL